MLLGGRGMSAKPSSRSVTGLMVGWEKCFSRLMEFECVLEWVFVVQFELQPELLGSGSKLKGRCGALIRKRVALKGRPETSMEQNKTQETMLGSSERIK